MAKLHVLSIDFDFFQNVTHKIIATCYPDGVDLPTDLSSVVWCSHYANPRTEKQILSVTPDIENMHKLQELILDNMNDHPYWSEICNSHVNAYDFILKYLTSHPQYTKVDIVNIDMHHDILNDNSELDCGNWLAHLKSDLHAKRIPCEITWIANRISKQAYGIEEKRFDFVETDFTSIRNTTWDLIFLCRSDNWLPPHLDNAFLEMANFIMDNSDLCEAEDSVLESRYNEEFRKNVEALRPYSDFQKMNPQIRKEDLYGIKSNDIGNQ